MSTLDICVTVTIKTDDRYCDEVCHYFKAAPSIAFPAWCLLFGRPLEHCLGGGPLRCAACLEAQQKPATNWQPIETAPKTGEHILAAIFGAGCGFGGPNDQAHCMVVHYWSNPGEEGFYPSNGPDEAYPATHWRPLESDQRNSEAR